MLGLPPSVSVDRRAALAGATGRLQTFDFRFDLTEHATRSGRARSRRCSCSCRTSAPTRARCSATSRRRSVDEARVVAVHERLLEDSAAGAGAADRRASCSCSTCSRRRRCCSTRRTTGRCAQQPRAGGVRGARAAVQRPSIEQPAAGRRGRCAASAKRRRRGALALSQTRVQAAGTTRCRQIRGEAVDAGARTCRATASYNDVNFVFPTWVTTQLPIGLVGLILAAIFAAAMSTISAELASLSTATVIDFYRRWIRPTAERPPPPERVALATGVLGAVRVGRRDLVRRSSDR